MPFEIVRNDLTKMHVDAIVNSANAQPIAGLGMDAAIHQAAGPKLLKARQKVGRISVGQAALTPGYDLPAKYVIHTVGPVWDGGSYGEESLLRNCYDRSLELARLYRCKSVAFPLIATNNYGFPKAVALQIAVAAFSAFLLEHEMQIYLVVFDRGAYQLSENLFQNVASFIDDHYVDRWEKAIYGPEGNTRSQQLRRRQDLELYRAEQAESHPCAPVAMPMAASKAAPKALSLQEMLKQADAGFTENLLKRIDASGKKDSEVYKKANLSKQHFSKIRNNPDYKPTKATAIALALALELDLEGTKDLIGRAGFALTNSSKFDLIIRYFIEQGQFDVMQINMVLYEFDQPLLGA